MSENETPINEDIALDNYNVEGLRQRISCCLYESESRPGFVVCMNCFSKDSPNHGNVSYRGHKPGYIYFDHGIAAGYSKCEYCKDGYSKISDYGSVIVKKSHDKWVVNV